MNMNKRAHKLATELRNKGFTVGAVTEGDELQDADIELSRGFSIQVCGPASSHTVDGDTDLTHFDGETCEHYPESDLQHFLQTGELPERNEPSPNTE